MTQDEILNGNIAIDIFMGKSEKDEVDLKSVYAEDLDYNSNWSELIPVVEKIRLWEFNWRRNKTTQCYRMGIRYNLPYLLSWICNTYKPSTYKGLKIIKEVTH